MKLVQATLEQYMLNAGIFTYAGMCKGLAADETQKMQIDRTIQKLRRAKKLTMKRIGRGVQWQNVNSSAPHALPALNTINPSLYPQAADASL